MIEESVVEIFASQESVSIGRFDLEDTLLDLQNGNVESSATKIENGNTR